jgi:hypothetical protein
MIISDPWKSRDAPPAYSERKTQRQHSYTPCPGLINYIDNKAKCRHLKKLTYKGVYQSL